MDRQCRIVKLGDGYSFDSEVNALVKHYDLIHGDIVAHEEEDRFALARILSYDNNNKSYRLIPNPDDSASGYITIPNEGVLATIEDFKRKYSDVIKETPCINFYVSSNDIFLTEKFGSNVPEGFEFNIEFTWGDMESFYVRNNPQAEWKDFDFDNLTLQQMQDWFTEADKPQSKYAVKVELTGDKLKEYKEKYSPVGRKPEMPPGWDCEFTLRAAGPDCREWTWICTGPEESKKTAVRNVQEFLAGFPYHVIDD